tara:strand:+ start:118 stop:315 length:198 start_codon:yes stop_codon:yes gene_type:complete
MILECPIKIGSLVVDANPYRAPEMLFGLGVVTKIFNCDFVYVYWNKFEVTECVNIGLLEVVNEGG